MAVTQTSSSTPGPPSEMTATRIPATQLPDWPTDAPPLTTVYTYPPECANRWVFGPSSGTVFSGLYFWVDQSNYFSDDGYRLCQPYAIAPYYSPGVCPSGHTIAYVTKNHVPESTGSTTIYWEAACCRSGMHINTNGFSCEGYFSTPVTVILPITSVITMGITGTLTTLFFETATSGFYGTVASISTVTTGMAVADAVFVNWQMSDLSVFPTMYASSVAQQIGVKLEGPTSTEPQVGTSTPTSKGLSTGTKAGITAGAVLGSALIAAFVLSFLIRRRRHMKAATAGTTNSPAEMEDLDPAARKWYLGGRWRSEAEAKNAHQELDSRVVNVVPGPPLELDASEQSARDRGA